MTIYFYTPQEIPYGCFSNFSRHGFELEENWWQTSEHYFQAQKFINHPWFEKIREAKTPKEAAQMGRDRRYPLRSDWEDIKDEIMLKAVLKKFETHADICQLLLETGEELIVENSPIDYYWGWGKNGSGKNKLGLTLIKVRQILKSKLYSP